MSQTMSRLTDRGRGFINKHILKKQQAAPPRPQAAAPTPPPPRPLQPPRAPSRPQTLEPDRFGNDSPEESLPVQALSPDQLGNDSPEELDIGQPKPPAPLPPGYTTMDALPPGYATTDEFAAAVDISSLSSSEESSEDEPDFEELYGQQRKPHAQVNAERTATGMKAGKVGDEYEGEYNKAGWRKAGQGAERTDMVTRLYTEEEQRANELAMGAEGRFTRGGASVGNQKVGYAMDASGRMVAFEEIDNAIVRTAQDGTETREQTSRALDIMGGHQQLQPGERLEMAHHSTALGGDLVTDADGKPVLDAAGKPVMRARPAASAGFVSFDYMGKIVEISNCSGHYKPTVDQLAQAIEHLLKQGAFFKDEVTDANGKQLGSRSKEMRLYQATQGKLAQSTRLAERVAGLTEALQQAEQAGDERAQASLGATLEQVGAELDSVRKQVEEAKAVLGKLGVGPSNRVRGEAKAEYVQAKKDMTGMAVRGAATATMGAVDFMKTGGGNTGQAALKAAVGQEVKGLTGFSMQDRERMTELNAKGKDSLTKDEAKELAALTRRYQVARSAHYADKEAEERTQRAGSGNAAVPDVKEALSKLGVSDLSETESESESDTESSSESESL